MARSTCKIREHATRPAARDLGGLSHGASHALRVHRLTLRLPKFETYEEASQVRRSSKSVSALIVEGHALRQYKAEYLRYLARAYGSSEETIEHLVYLLETGSAEQVFEECKLLVDGYVKLCRKLFNYQTSVEKQHSPTRRYSKKLVSDDGE
jgi:four helix bundle protein